MQFWIEYALYNKGYYIMQYHAGKSRIQCLARAMDILEIISKEPGIGVSELARKTGLHVATVNNIAHTLSSRRYLHNFKGRYSIGAALAALSPAWNPLLTSCFLSSCLTEIVHRNGGSAIVSMLVGNSMRILASTFEADEIIVQFPNQIVENPLDYATGRILVALGRESEWPAFSGRARPLQRKAGNENTAWFSELRKIRASGYAKKVRGDRSISIGVPVFGPGKEVLAAVGGVCPAVNIKKAGTEGMLNDLNRAADEISGLISGSAGTRQNIKSCKENNA